MLQAGIEADTAIQNSIMRLARQQGQGPAQLEEYLLRLLTLGLQPNEQTFHVLLRAYLDHGNTVEATSILDRMGAHGMGMCCCPCAKQLLFNSLFNNDHLSQSLRPPCVCCISVSSRTVHLINSMSMWILKIGIHPKKITQTIFDLPTVGPWAN